MDTRAFFIAWEPRVLSILRIVAALLFFEHGTQKILGFPEPKYMPKSSLSVGLPASWKSSAAHC